MSIGGEWPYQTSEVDVIKECHDVSVGSSSQAETDPYAAESSSFDTQSVSSTSTAESGVSRGPPHRNSKVRLRAKTRLPVEASLITETQTRQGQAGTQQESFSMAASKALRFRWRNRAATVTGAHEANRLRPCKTQALSASSLQGSIGTPESFQHGYHSTGAMPAEAKAAQNHQSSWATIWDSQDQNSVSDPALERIEEEDLKAMKERELALLHSLSIADLEEKIAGLKERLARYTDILLGELCLKAELESEALEKADTQDKVALHLDMVSLEPYVKVHINTHVSNTKKLSRWHSVFG